MSSLTGDVAELVCSVRGKPTPEVQWRKDGGLETIYIFLHICICIFEQVKSTELCDSTSGFIWFLTTTIIRNVNATLYVNVYIYIHT